MNINSSNIKVYPTASRSPEIDYAANLNVEQNIVALSNNIVDYSSYIINGLDLNVVDIDGSYFCAISLGKFIFNGYSIELNPPQNIPNIIENYRITGLGQQITIPPGGTSFTGILIRINNSNDEILLNGTLNTSGSKVLYNYNIYVYDTNYACYVYNNPLISSLNQSPNNVIYFDGSDESNGIVRIIDRSSSYVIINNEAYLIIDTELDTEKINYVYSTIKLQPQIVNPQVSLNRINGTDIDNDGVYTYSGIEFNIAKDIEPTGTNNFNLGILNYDSGSWEINQISKNKKFNSEHVQINLNETSGLVNKNYNGSFIDLLKDYLIIDDGKVGNNIED